MSDPATARAASGTADRRPWQRVLASLLCAACMVLGSPDASWWWLGLVGWVPWLYAIEGLGPKKAFWYGWLTGTITVFWGFIWLTQLLDKFAGFGIAPRLFIHLLFASFQGLQWAVPAALIVWLRRRTGRDVLLIAPLCWVAGEALLPHVFPSYLALMWCYEPRWLQLAEIGRELEKRRSAIIAAIEKQNKMTPALLDAITHTEDKAHLEDLYLPYRKKRRTKAQIAHEAGLQPLRIHY